MVRMCTVLPVWSILVPLLVFQFRSLSLLISTLDWITFYHKDSTFGTTVTGAILEQYNL